MSEAAEVLWPASAAWPEYNDGSDTDGVRAALAALTVDQARELAERATHVLETRRSEEPYDEGYQARIDTGEFLIQLVCHVPNVLEGLYDRLLDAGVLAPDCSWSGNTSLLFCDAGPAVRDRLIAKVEAGPPGNGQVHEALAWIGDEVVREAMGRWADARNRWYSPWLDAGWDLYGVVHVTVDLSGRSVWHEASDRASHVDHPALGATLRLGEERPRPFSGHPPRSGCS